MNLIAFGLFVFGLVIGVGGGWLAGSRPSAVWRARFETRDTEAKELDSEVATLKDERSRMVAELATMSERASRADKLGDTLQESEQMRSEVEKQLAALKSEAAERERAAEVRYHEREKQFARELHQQSEQARIDSEKALAALSREVAEREKAADLRYQEREEQFKREMERLREAEEKLQVKFGEISEKMLSDAQSKFMEGAHERLEGLNKSGLVELEKRVGPISETLERYRKRIDEIERGRAEAYHQLQGVIKEVRDGQERVMEGANRISTTLRGATKARGDWGEVQFVNLLESCGLSDRTDFDCQVSYAGEDGALRPDAIINIPGGRKLVVDVKNVFNTYARANEADTEEERRELLRAHVRELKVHIDQLSAKRYQDHVEGSADFVVMFVPGEHVLYTALSQDSNLLDYALQKRIVLSSPLNFMSIALTVSTIWRQAGIQVDAEEIARLGKEMYDRLAVVAGHISQLRRSLSSTNQHFDRLVGSFDTNLRRTGERFEQLSIDTSAKQLEEAEPINAQPRRLSNFADLDD